MKQTYEFESDSPERTPPEDARQRLLDAAEQLFAEQGIQGASVRDITRLAQANLGAINYHFGTKHALLTAVLERRVMPVNAQRLQLLDRLELEAAGAPIELEGILAALWIPTIPLFEQQPHFLRFMGRLVSEPDPAIRQLLPRHFGEMTRRFVAAIGKALPDLPELEVWARFHFMIGAMIHTWTNQADIELFVGPGHARPTAKDMVRRLVEFCAAGFRASIYKGRSAQ